MKKKICQIPENVKDHLKDMRQSKKTEKDCVRYYLWTYSSYYGWQQLGSIVGYSSLSKLQKDFTFKFVKRQAYIYRITKSIIAKGN